MKTHPAPEIQFQPILAAPLVLKPGLTDWSICKKTQVFAQQLRKSLPRLIHFAQLSPSGQKKSIIIQPRHTI
jgi:hypothetical protein